MEPDVHLVGKNSLYSKHRSPENLFANNHDIIYVIAGEFAGSESKRAMKRNVKEVLIATIIGKSTNPTKKRHQMLMFDDFDFGSKTPNYDDPLVIIVMAVENKEVHKLLVDIESFVDIIFSFVLSLR